MVARKAHNLKTLFESADRYINHNILIIAEARDEYTAYPLEKNVQRDRFRNSLAA